MNNEIKDLAKSIAELKELREEIPTEIDINDSVDCEAAADIATKLERIEQLLEYISRDLPKIEAYLQKLS